MPVAVDLFARLEVGDRVLVVLDLRPRVEVLARLAVALAEVAVVEREHRDARVGERARVLGQHELLHVTPAARHRERGMGTLAFGQIEVAAHAGPLAAELDVLSRCHDASPLSRASLPKLPWDRRLLSITRARCEARSVFGHSSRALYAVWSNPAAGVDSSASARTTRTCTGPTRSRSATSTARTATRHRANAARATSRSGRPSIPTSRARSSACARARSSCANRAASGRYRRWCSTSSCSRARSHSRRRVAWRRSRPRRTIGARPRANRAPRRGRVRRCPTQQRSAPVMPRGSSTPRRAQAAQARVAFSGSARRTPRRPRCTRSGAAARSRDSLRSATYADLPAARGRACARARRRAVRRFARRLGHALDADVGRVISCSIFQRLGRADDLARRRGQ